MLTGPATIHAPKAAEALAATLTADAEDGWTYRVKHDPAGTGGSLIAAYDDTGHLVGLM